jgi:hypothetical protein
MKKFKKELSNDKNVEFIENKISEEKLNEIYSEFKNRKDNSKIDAAPIFVFFYYIESGKIFSGNSFSDKNMKIIEELIKNGPEFGIHISIYTTDFSTLTNADLSRNLSMFKKKMAISGENSLKVFGSNNSVAFSKSKHISLIERGVLGEKVIKFKPFINKNIIEENNE